MTTTPIAWPEAQRICDIPEVREALDKFAADAHEENMLAMVSAIMGHASTQGRAAGLEEAARMVEDYQAESAPVHFSVVASDIRALSPTPSDAGKDDARDAALEEAAQAVFATGHVNCQYHAAVIRALSISPSDVVKDAARYRWMMRDNETAIWVALSHLCAEDGPIKPQMDEAIDAALSSLTSEEAP